MGSATNNATVAAFAHIEQKVKAERYLIGAMLREPYNMPNVIGLLNPVALSNAHNNLAESFAEIIKQFKERGNYSAISVAAKTGNENLSTLAASDTEIDLAWAVENWIFEYQKWAEATALSSGLSEIKMVSGALSMREEVEAVRRELGAVGAEVTTTGAEQFMEMAIDKLEGRELTYKTNVPIPDFQRLVKHFKPKNLWIVAGRPGMGKTQFALNMVSWFHDNGAKGMFFSLEMGAEDLFMRLLGIRHGINPNADWSGLDKQVVGKAISEVASLKDSITVIDNALSIAEIEAAATAKHYTGGLEYIVVDYLQLVVASGKPGNREAEVGSVADALMRLSIRLNVPVIALAQLSRAVEVRGGSKRPMLSDLRESGRIEQSAYGIIFLYRAEYYGIMDDESGQSMKDKGEVIVAKHRNGDTGQVPVKWNKIRGYSAIEPESDAFSFKPTELVDYTIPQSARPSADFDIPF